MKDYEFFLKQGNFMKVVDTLEKYQQRVVNVKSESGNVASGALGLGAAALCGDYTGGGGDYWQARWQGWDHSGHPAPATRRRKRDKEGAGNRAT